MANKWEDIVAVFGFNLFRDIFNELFELIALPSTHVRYTRKPNVQEHYFQHTMVYVISFIEILAGDRKLFTK